jgi:tetratricopeptide (TPR) repeat protein
MFTRSSRRLYHGEAFKIRTVPVLNNNNSLYPSRHLLQSRSSSRSSTSIDKRRLLHLPLLFCTNTNANINHLPKNAPTQTQRRLLVRLLQQQQQPGRNLTYLQWLRLGFKKASKDIWRKNPILLPLAIVSVIAISGLLAYVIYVEYWFVRPQYRKFPPAVEKPLRRAVYYTEIHLDPQKALELYKEALRIALQQEGMHPYSKEVLGIKIQASAMLQKAGLFAPAIQILEQTSKEALAWVEESRRRSALRRKQKDRNKTEGGDRRRLTSDTDGSLQTGRGEKGQEAREEDEAEVQEEQTRSWTLQKVVGMKMSLGLLYEEDRKHQKALDAQTAAIELLLKEMNRRQSLGLPLSAKGSEADDGWMDSESIAFAFENTAESFQERNHPQLAIPLYLKSLELLWDTGDAGVCHRAVVMNNISGAMITSLQLTDSISSAERAQTVDAAQQWAQRAYDTATQPRAQQVTERDQCGETSVTAMFNLGHIAELQNRRSQAEHRYQEARRLAVGLKWGGGIKQAGDALHRLQEQGTTQRDLTAEKK